MCANTFFGTNNMQNTNLILQIKNIMVYGILSCAVMCNMLQLSEGPGFCPHCRPVSFVFALFTDKVVDRLYLVNFCVGYAVIVFFGTLHSILRKYLCKCLS